MPTVDSIDLNGLDVSREDMEELLRVDKELWMKEAESITEYYAKFGDKLHKELAGQLDALKRRLQEE